MCISCFAAYLNPFHPVGEIRFFHHQALVYRLGETRPSATRIKLIGRDKQRFPGRDIYVDAFQYSFLKALSVAFCCVTAYCSAVSLERNV